MRVIIAGSRSCEDPSSVYRAVDESKFNITTVISGTARGVDIIGEEWAIENNVPLIRMPANWTHYGRSADKIRNVEMALLADALIAVWDGVSPGTGHMIDVARARGLQIYVYLFSP